MARGEHELPDDPGWLTSREAEQAAAMRFTKHRTEYLLRRWVAKHAVAIATGASTDRQGLARVEIGNRVSGAPYVLVDGLHLGLDVSLTDRAGWAVCVIGGDLSRIGCDLEIVEVRSRGFVTDYLTDEEQAYVAIKPSGDARDAAANLLWSAKESALKVLRTGLRRDTRSVEVTVGEPSHGSVTNDWGSLTIATSEGTTLFGWWRREGAMLLTVASDMSIEPPEQLPGSAPLRDALPVHSWVAQPLAPGWPVEPA
jgi:4'-phosphopantetheinyl transferase